MGTSKGATVTWSFAKQSSTSFEMPPKPAAGQPVEIMLRSVGGEPANMATLAPKLGPLGVPPKKASDAIQAATKDWKGLRVTVKLIIENRVPRVELVNSSTALVLRAIKEPPRDRKKFSGTVCEILGTCGAVGCSVEGQHPQDIIVQIKDGSI